MSTSSCLKVDVKDNISLCSKWRQNYRETNLPNRKTNNRHSEALMAINAVEKED